MLKEEYLPPVEVYKLGPVFFVKDGNHRVSVARERGQKFIDACVTEIDLPYPVDENLNIDKIIQEEERAEFYEHSRINSVRPNSRIELSMIGQYKKLLEHIGVHRYFMGKDLQREITYEEAAASWYDHLYLPLAKIIRKKKILERFPQRTEADLYLWVIEHMAYLKEHHADITSEEAALHFTEHYAPKSMRAWLSGIIRKMTRRGTKK